MPFVMPRRRHASATARLPACMALLLTLMMALLPLLLMACTPKVEPPPERERVVDTQPVRGAAEASVTTLSGRINAAERTSLSFEIAGEVARLSLDVGDRFAAGDALATLDAARYRLVLNQRRAAEDEARAQLQEKRQDYSRQARLREKGFASQAHLDSARAALDSASSRLASAQAARELAERDLRQTTLRAPFAGSISQRHVEPAERVNANQPVFEVISEREGFEVETSVPETLIGALETGSRHRVSVPALDGVTTTATLVHLGTQPRSSNNYPLVLALDEPIPGLRSGMTAQVALAVRELATRETATLRLPLTALVYAAEGDAHVLRVGDDRRLERVSVEVIAVDAGVAAVRGDLAPGQRVVARGAEFVSPGETVSLLGQGPERYH